MLQSTKEFSCVAITAVTGSCDMTMDFIESHGLRMKTITIEMIGVCSTWPVLG